MNQNYTVPFRNAGIAQKRLVTRQSRSGILCLWREEQCNCVASGYKEPFEHVVSVLVEIDIQGKDLLSMCRALLDPSAKNVLEVLIWKSDEEGPTSGQFSNDLH